MTDSRQYPVVVYPDHCTDGTFCYVAMHPDLLGCAAHGESIAEARALLGHAKEIYLEALAAEGRTAPKPSEGVPSEITWEVGSLSYSYQQFKQVAA